MGELFGEVHRATARVYARAGIALDATTGQGCCGALHAHDGDLDFARDLARSNIDALEHTAPSPIVVNSAGCGAAMKEYGQLLAHDEIYAERAAAFGARVVDATEPLAGLNLQGRLPEAATVAYQDACHLAHAQRIREQPRTLIDGIANCTRVDTQGADMCCGAAGIYSLVQPEMSAQLRGRKAEAFKAADADFVVTANPGCHMQYEVAVQESGTGSRVLHIMELLDMAEVEPAG
jgi:glycolate oxidase iron-sulfur subunit